MKIIFHNGDLGKSNPIFERNQLRQKPESQLIVNLFDPMIHFNPSGGQKMATRPKIESFLNTHTIGTKARLKSIEWKLLVISRKLPMWPMFSPPENQIISHGTENGIVSEYSLYKRICKGLETGRRTNDFYITSDSDFDIYTQDYFQRPQTNTGNVSQVKPAHVCLCNLWTIFRKWEHYWRTRGLSVRRNNNIPEALLTNMI